MAPGRRGGGCGTRLGWQFGCRQLTDQAASRIIEVSAFPLPGGPMKTCASCGTSFAPTGPNHRYCSRDCRLSRGVEYPDGRRSCVRCATAFTRTSLAQRYCSVTCRASTQADYPRRMYAARLGRPVKPHGATPDLAKRARVKALRDAGMKLADIAAVLGVTPPAVSSLLTRMKQAGSVVGGVGAERPTIPSA